MDPNKEGACSDSLGFESKEELIAAAAGKAGKSLKDTGREFGKRVAGR